ncbi:PKD domain-containing protein, partial [Flavobacteriales bacterium]|nr:PKD domain-containing protein [Flavobacteriales bacterium]
ETNGGTTTTFLAPSADGGFRFDIFKLDNSFNLNVNGTDVVAKQIQCQGGGATGESLLVFSTDNTGFGQGGNDNVWVINGDANEPVVRLIIEPNGEVSFQGKRNSGRGLESMEILGGDPQSVNVTWNSAGNNTVILSQSVVGATNISGEGNGIVLCVTDTDGDGILNSFDTDSDGDECLDAIEGGADFKLTDINNDELAGAIDANGVPLAANGGQNVGSSEDENVKSNECGCDDNDNDGVCNAIDLDDDNDGILDVEECMTSNFQWSTPPQVNGKTAIGKINGVNYTYTSSINIETTPSIFAYNRFPTTYNIPNTTVIKNRFISNNTITFAQPVLNPTLLFSSIGGGNAVPVRFSNQVEVLFQSGPVTIDSPTQLTAKEGYVILRMNGTFSEISFDYLANENYVNFTFGADFATFCDTDNDGTPDYLDTDSDNDGCLDAVEGDAGFKLTDVNGNDILAGAIDANGVPVASAGGQGKGSSADAAIEALVCAVCAVEKPVINGVDGQAFHSFYFDADQPLNETVNGLAARERYKVKVTGTWSIWSSDPTKNVIDAAYRYKQKNASADIVPIAGIYWQLNGASPSQPVPDGYNAEHTYFFEPIATGNGEVFFFSDNNYGDNGGGMNFEFYKILDTIRVCASNTNTLLIEYTDGQDLKWYSSETSNDATTNVPNIDNNIAGLTEYWVTQTINGCESDRIQILYLVKPLPVVELGADIDLCSGESVILNAGNHASYLWNTTATTSDIEVAATKTYSVEVTDSKGCVGRDTVSVVIQQCQERLCGGDINFNTWIQAGLSTEGNWVVSGDGSSVNQTINGSPTFYNGKKDYLNVKFSGKMRTDFGGDDDFIGMVFGYQGDLLIANYPITIKTYVFGWKQKNQVVFGNDWPEGFSLIEVNKTVNTRQEFYEAFTAPFTGSTVLATDYGPGKGYLTGIDYNVSIEYTSTKIKIYVDNNLIFDVDGCFDSGKIGFYNFSQPDVTYSDFNYQFISDIAVSDDTLCIGEEIELDLTCNQTNFYPDGTIYSWDLDDGTKSNLEEIDHTYQTPGVYDLELIVSDGIGCSDTATQKVYISAYPIKQLGNDTTICADSSITLEAERKIGNSYLWSTNETTEQITVNNTGEYRVDVVNWAECITKDTINVTMQGLPVVNLGNDTTICADSIITFTAQTGVVWNWNNGDITPIITVNLTGEYSVIVADEIGCTSYETIKLVMQALPVIDLGNDTTICEDVTVTFDAEVGAFWGWNNGDNTRIITVNLSGEYSVIVADEIGCTGYDTIQLATQNLPLVNLGNDTIICDGESVVLDSKNGGLNYSWNTGQTVQEITIKTTGVYGVEVTDDIGCLGSDSMELIVNPMPHVNLGNDTAICFGESVILNAQNPGFNYLWSTSDNQQSITVSQTSIVSVEVYDEIGCSDEDEISINVHQLPVVNLGNDTVLCKYQSLVLDAENVRLNFSWNTGDKSQTITVDEEGGYSVDVTDEIGCLGSDEIYVTKEFLPDPYFEKDKIICEGTAITLGPDAGFESYEIYWLSNVASFEIEVTETGAYSSVIQSEFCKDTFMVNVAKIDTPDAVIIDLYGGGVYCFELESTALRIGSEEANISYDWIDFGRAEEVEIVAAGDYQVTASNDYCTSNYTHTIQEYCTGKLFIPNSFTPNNDGINDVFKPMSNGHVDDFDFRVYNRWGDLIFQTNRLDEGWDGRLRNNIVLIDVFVYKISYQYLSEKGGFEKEELVGTVTVLK